MVVDKRINHFLAELESANPTPGGGSTSALVGGLSTALAKMVCNTTLRKKEDKEISEYLEELDQARIEFEKLITADIEAYQKVIKAYKSQDQELIEVAMKRATDVPLMIMEETIEVLEIMEKLMKLINHTSLGELGTAVFLADSVLNSMALIVEINSELIIDEKYKNKIIQVSADKLKHGEDLKNKSLSKLQKRQRNK
jgi:formiminotetrahydrofolate cyclodeaminase